ncbi:DDE-type integrase/transposase/recombinase [Enterococcus hulanensis]|nr:DDE-type integrase/transposase/recombinase [Enterococcus hulanensis]
MTTWLVLNAFIQAIGKERPRKNNIHTDQCSQYTSSAFQKVLRECEITSSMSRKGNLYDKALMESF